MLIAFPEYKTLPVQHQSRQVRGVPLKKGDHRGSFI